jgi:hypothetical protein
MGRRNMRLNKWEDLVSWLKAAGVECYAELIWGAPGESFDSFLKGYDQLARSVPRIATYPLILLPNTTYANRRQEYGFVTVRGDQDDFEYVIANRDMSMADNQRMQRFLLWARGVAENLVLRNVWLPLRGLVGMTQSQVLLSMADWFDQCGDTAAAGLKLHESLLGRPSAIPTFLRHLYSTPRLDDLLWQWWHDRIEDNVPITVRPFLSDVFRYDLVTRAIYDPPDRHAPALYGLDEVQHGQETYYVRRAQRFDYDVPVLVSALRHQSGQALEPNPIMVDIWYRCGFMAYIDNHELAAHFVGRPRRTEASVKVACW